MDEDIAGIISRYGWEGIPDDLRDIYEDYFNNGPSDSDSESEVNDRPLATELDPPQEDVLEIFIEDIPIFLEEDILRDGEALLDIPVEVIETPIEDAPVVGGEEDNADIFPIWEVVEMNAVAEEIDASIRTRWWKDVVPNGVSTTLH